MWKDRIYFRCKDCGNIIDANITISRDKNNRDPEEIKKLQNDTFKCPICGKFDIKWDGTNAFYVDEIQYI